MAYKSLLTIATTPDPVGTTIAAAAAIAQRMDAHLDILAVGLERALVGSS